MQEWADNLQSPEKIQKFEEKLKTASLPHQTELGKLIFNKKKEEIEGHLKIYLEAFTQTKTHLDKIDKAIQEKEEAEKIQALYDDFREFICLTLASEGRIAIPPEIQNVRVN